MQISNTFGISSHTATSTYTETKAPKTGDVEVNRPKNFAKHYYRINEPNLFNDVSEPPVRFWTLLSLLYLS